MLAAEQKYVFEFKGKRKEVLKMIRGDFGERILVAVVISVNGGRVLVLNRDYPGLVDEDTCEVNASFKNHLFRIK